MPSEMLLFVNAVKLVAEIALLSFAGRFVVGLLAGQRREQNFVWRLFGTLTMPFERVARAVSPRIVLDRHMPLLAFVLLLLAWLAATVSKIAICVQPGMNLCR